MNEDVLKMKAALLFVVAAFDGVDILRAFKILYFANKDHLARYGRPIINDIFCALPNGPVPSMLYDAVKKAQGKRSGYETPEIEELARAIIVGEEDLDYVIYKREMPDLDELSKSDIECLKKSLIENRNLSFRELSDKSHDFAWDEAWKKSPASKMDIVSIARAAGASNDLAKYIQEQSEIDAILS